MQYLCERQLILGGRTYNPGEVIPDGIVLDSRAGKLENSGCISVIRNTQPVPQKGSPAMYTQEQVDKMLEEAIEEAVNNTVMEMGQKQQELQAYVPELCETVPGAYEGTVQVSIEGTADGKNGQVTVIPATPGEIKQVFSIMQMNAEEGVKEIAGVTSGNVLVLLHAADSRKTIKNAAKGQAGRLPSVDIPDTGSSTERNDA
ncbi:MAG: hypothetical protein K1W15_09655 [Lachnospiraceae bacterium]